jgi:hypothetical protein
MKGLVTATRELCSESDHLVCQPNPQARYRLRRYWMINLSLITMGHLYRHEAPLLLYVSLSNCCPTHEHEVHLLTTHEWLLPPKPLTARSWELTLMNQNQLLGYEGPVPYVSITLAAGRLTVPPTKVMFALQARLYTKGVELKDRKHQELLQSLNRSGGGRLFCHLVSQF